MTFCYKELPTLICINPDRILFSILYCNVCVLCIFIYANVSNHSHINHSIYKCLILVFQLIVFFIAIALKSCICDYYNDEAVFFYMYLFSYICSSVLMVLCHRTSRHHSLHSFVNIYMQYKFKCPIDWQFPWHFNLLSTFV